MSRAEERALEAYPVAIGIYSDNCREYDTNESDRLTYQEGYKQAEKDTIKRACDILSTIYPICLISDRPKIIEAFRKKMEEEQ